MRNLFRKKRIYLDYAAATPVRREVYNAMAPYWSEDFGNAGAIHTEGVKASSAIEEARGEIASLLHIRSEGVVFTSSGTESNNLALLGTIEARHAHGMKYEDMEVISTRIEHPSVLNVLEHLASRGVRVLYAPLQSEGQIDVKAFETLLSAQTVLVSVAYANSEIGVVQPMGRITRAAKAAQKKFGTRIYVHVDAAQAPLWLPCELDVLGCDLLSLDAGKCYGPKGIGILAHVHGVHLSPHMFGGSQEGGLRPGTENTALIVGAAVALCIAFGDRVQRSKKVAALRDLFIKKLETIDGVILNGSREERIANNVNVSIPGIDSEFAVVTLDEHGIAASTKSACGGARGDGSAVVLALTQDESRARSTIRFSLGEETTKADADAAAEALRQHVEKMRTFARGLA